MFAIRRRSQYLEKIGPLLRAELRKATSNHEPCRLSRSVGIEVVGSNSEVVVSARQKDQAYRIYDRRLATIVLSNKRRQALIEKDAAVSRITRSCVWTRETPIVLQPEFGKVHGRQPSRLGIGDSHPRQ
ncbi:hypothetical protein GCM10022197_26260 [Microlunatus spumicola]|uniref:Uncharacterized protein n=1 Tax=Microlunatus spumicola TaxID=81499 RepID=A0ABP6XPW6_9ACTN